MGRLRTRMFAAALIGYGAVGVLLLAGLAVSLLPMTATIDAIARSSDDVRSTLLTTQNAFDDFSTSLGAARRLARRARAARAVAWGRAAARRPYAWLRMTARLISVAARRRRDGRSP